MRDESPLRSPFREIRAVREREDGPWPGVLVRLATGSVGVLVDAGLFGPDWRGWDAAPGGHVLAPIDLVRTPAGGHDVLLPVCAERLEDFMRRRGARGALAPGEAVTLGVSVLRGCAQLLGTPEVTGEWWLDDSGRPVLATGVSSQSAFAAAAAMLEAASVDAAVNRAWGAAVQALSAVRVAARDLSDAEELLFTAADPEPLSTISLRPRRAVDVAIDPRAPAQRADDVPPRALWQSLIGSVDADLADTVSRATTAVWRRMRTPTRSRRAPLLVGAAVAATVLAGGALWPSAGGVASADHPSSEATGSSTAPMSTGGTTTEAVSSEATPMPSEPAADDVTAATAALLDARRTCAGDPGCLREVVADPAAPLGSGVIDAPSAQRALTLLDDFGDIAVLRVDAVDGALPAQLVVVVRQDEKWLLRDVHDVAQQP